MVKKRMYQKIQGLKKRGYSKSWMSRELKLDRGTVSKYFDMTEAEFRAYQNSVQYRSKNLDEYRNDILEIYRENDYRKLNMASVYDCLEEKKGELNCSEKSLRNYIRFLIKTRVLTIHEKVRLYTKVPELPFGKQMQLDFGQYRTPSGLKLYIFACILSASRYKYVAFQERPFRTMDVILHLLDAFDYFGGIPEEMVIDQDSILVVSENRGDIIYTKDFKYFIDEMGLEMYVCRKADPETKGKIENLIKYVKNNFFQTRDFSDIESATPGMRDWLRRRANGKISCATRRIPLELIEEERKHLRSVRNSIFQKDSLSKREDRKVDEKSFISFLASFYSVPMEYLGSDVEIYGTQTNLYIFDPHTGVQIAEHIISRLPGQRIVIKWHFRNTGRKSKDLQYETAAMYESELWRRFASVNCKRFSRYVRDQCLDARKYFSDGIATDILEKALLYCIENGTYSYANLRDAYSHFQEESVSDAENKISVNGKPTIRPARPWLNVQTRNLDAYREFLPSTGRSS